MVEDDRRSGKPRVRGVAHSVQRARTRVGNGPAATDFSRYCTTVILNGIVKYPSRILGACPVFVLCDSRAATYG